MSWCQPLETHFNPRRIFVGKRDSTLKRTSVLKNLFSISWKWNSHNFKNNYKIYNDKDEHFNRDSSSSPWKLILKAQENIQTLLLH